MKYAIVLAAGKGTRMKSNHNKVMHPILAKPMIGHVVDNLEKSAVDKIVVVCGYKRSEIESYLKDRVDYALQDEQCGTADAVSRVTQLQGEGSTVIVFGDCALIQPETFAKIFAVHEGHDLTIVSTKRKDPGRHSRIIRDNQGTISRIADSRDLSETESTINEINLGMYCVDNRLLFEYLKKLSDDPESNELNIIGLVEVMKKDKRDVQVYRVDEYEEFLGVNDRNELLQANKWLQNYINHKHIENGVTIVDPASTYIGPDVSIGMDSIIYPDVHIYGHSVIGEDVEIRPGSWLENAAVDKNVKLDAAHIIDSAAGAYTTVGPFAHLRMNTKIGQYVRIGNFMEYKNTIVGDHTHSAHLSYLGDSIIGEHVNIGCGVVTVNYDGKHKYKTEIDDGAFIGSNANLIAPIKVGKKAVVAAGSTATEDLAAGAMLINRAEAVVKEGSGARYLKKGDK